MAELEIAYKSVKVWMSMTDSTIISLEKVLLISSGFCSWASFWAGCCLSVCLLIMNWTMLPVINSHYLGIAGDNSTLGTMSFNLLSQRNKSNSELSKTYRGESEIYFGNSKIYIVPCIERLVVAFITALLKKNVRLPTWVAWKSSYCIKQIILCTCS